MLTDRKHSILIVEEDKATRDLVKASIEGTEFTYWEAQGSQDALEFAKRVQDIAIDFLVVDARLRPSHGADLARKVLQHRPELKTLFLSDGARDAGGMELPGQRCDSIHKPLQKGELLDKLRGLLHSDDEAVFMRLPIGMES